MNTTIDATLKVLGCGTAALTLSMIFAWSFVESTSVARWVSPEEVAQVVATMAASRPAVRLARANQAVLVD